MSDAAACTPNISARGVRRRWILAQIAALATLFLMVVLVGFEEPAWAFVLLFLPAAVAWGCILQVRRRVCVAHARRGTFEHDDLSTTPMEAHALVELRRVAREIRVQAALVGVGVAAVGAATTLLR